jgi:hypothetical protein
MPIFAILMQNPQPRLAEAIKSTFPNDHYAFTDAIWLVSMLGTVTDVTAKLGIFDPKEPTKPPIGIAAVFAVSSYSGRAPQTLWDWLKIKLEVPPSV